VKLYRSGSTTEEIFCCRWVALDGARSLVLSQVRWTQPLRRYATRLRAPSNLVGAGDFLCSEIDEMQVCQLASARSSRYVMYRVEPVNH
jgi:hypothetical protein